MTPQTLRIDRRFKGVGRIHRVTGTTDPRVLRNYQRMLDFLGNDGQYIPILRGIRDGVYTFAEAYDAYQRHALHELATGPGAKPLIASYKDWHKGLEVGDHDGADCSEKHHQSLDQSRKYFETVKLAGGRVPRVADLPDIVRALRDSLGKRHPTSFNHARAAALTFLRSTLTRAHPFWIAVSAVERRKIRRKKKNNPPTAELMTNLFPARDIDPIDAIAWGMFTTGMLEKEYWGEWSVLTDRVRIHGTKRAGRDRFVPLVHAPAVPTMHPRTFTNKLRERTRVLTASDFRDGYANALEGARIIRTRRKLYMGHGKTDVTDIYERHEVDAFLVEDAAAIRKYLGLPTPPAPLQLVKENA